MSRLLLSRTLRKTRRRRGFSARGLVLSLVLILGVPAIAWSVLRGTGWPARKVDGPMMHHVERGRFVHQITEQGDIESAHNVEIVSKVKSGYGGGSGGAAILWIIPEGTYVEAGDKVCELDSSSLELEQIQQEIVVRNSEAAVTQAKNSYEAAKIAKEEYLNGTYREDELTLDNQIEEATETRDRLKEYWEFSKGMHERGYVTKMQLEADYSALQQAQNKVDLAVLKRKVLEDYKKAKMVLQLDADIATAEAKLEAAKANLDLDQQRLDDIKEQFENCTIYTQSAGQVVYANREGRRGGEGQIIIEEGVMIRERQAIIRLPDPNDMQVTAEVNEAKISLVKVGMSATIRLDAFPDTVLGGQVVAVKEYPAPTGFGSTVKKYQTVIKILDSTIPLRSGYTAEVNIRVEDLADVLLVPVQALIEHAGKFYCVMWQGEKLLLREVSIGSTNDKFVVITGGLEEGEDVVLNAAAYREDVGLPKQAPKAAAEPEESEADGEPMLPPGLEYDDGGQMPGEGGRGERGGGGRSNAAQMFQRLDANGSGQIEADELAELPEQMQSTLMAADANGDGALDRAEMAGATARFGAGGSPRAGTPGGRGSGMGPGFGGGSGMEPGMGGGSGMGPGGGRPGGDYPAAPGPGGRP